MVLYKEMCENYMISNTKRTRVENEVKRKNYQLELQVCIQCWGLTTE